MRRQGKRHGRPDRRRGGVRRVEARGSNVKGNQVGSYEGTETT